MTSRPVVVEAQWALQGKGADSAGYRVLACSTGELSWSNFADAIGRFSTGTPETLPQVTLSYLRPTRPGGDYLSLGVHDLARPGPEWSGRDLHGRLTVFTSYFCIPYEPLAKAAIGYQDIYAAVGSVRLPGKNGPPLPLSVTRSPWLTPAVDMLAIRVAALLLTGQPVCVLGADSVSMEERLRFIDTVMALLPYGARARMTAATWTRATHHNHRFRLYFSGAQRDIEPPDHVVTWGNPETAVINAADTPAGKYLDWLSERVSQPVHRLRDLIEPAGFGGGHVTRMLRSVGVTDGTNDQQAEQARTPKATEQDPGAVLLAECATHARTPDLAKLDAAVERLQKMAGGQITPGQRAGYRELIKEHRLFRHDQALDGHEARLREALLNIAFGPSVSYPDYCAIEDGLDGSPPDPSLIVAIEKAGLSDIRVRAIVCWRMPEEKVARRLQQLCSSKDVDAVTLLSLLAGDWERPQHARAFCDVTVYYLHRMRQQYKAADVRRVLRQHGYMAHKLRANQVGNDQYQVNALRWFLIAAFPERIKRSDIYEVLLGNGGRPTPALLAALLLMLADPGDASAIRDAYLADTVMSMSLEPSIGFELQKLLGHDSMPDSSVPEPHRSATALFRRRRADGDLGVTIMPDD